MTPIYQWKNLDPKKQEIILKRSQLDVEQATIVAKEWIQKVKQFGDEAIVECTQKFDNPNFTADQIRVLDSEIQEALQKLPEKTLQAIKKQIVISKAFHEEQAQRVFQDESWEIETVPGVRTGAKKTPLNAVGLWIPAGKAPLPTVAQILTVAAKAAGVKRICVGFPPTGDNLEIIAAAYLAGATDIFRMSGTTGIAAFAYGTETVPRVDKIAGPGNPYVQAAKLAVFGQVGIDMLSGPSEALILADNTANPAFLAADVCARCEHGIDSSVVIATTDENLLKKVQIEIEKQLPNRSRKDIIKQSLQNGYTAFLVFDSEEELIDFANEYAAEHLQITMENAEEVGKKITNAGSMFLGKYATVPIGDYASGTNHCLPTSRAVHFSSPVGVEMFVKSVEYQVLTQEGLQNLWPIVDEITDVEGLDGHKNAIKIRLT